MPGAMLNTYYYPHRHRSHSIPSNHPKHPPPALSDPELPASPEHPRSAKDHLESPANPSSLPAPTSPSQKSKQSPYTLFASSTARVGRKFGRKSSTAEAPGPISGSVPGSFTEVQGQRGSDNSNPTGAPPRPLRNPARPLVPKRPSTSSGIPSRQPFLQPRLSTSSGGRSALSGSESGAASTQGFVPGSSSSQRPSTASGGKPTPSTALSKQAAAIYGPRGPTGSAGGREGMFFWEISSQKGSGSGSEYPGSRRKSTSSRKTTGSDNRTIQSTSSTQSQVGSSSSSHNHSNSINTNTNTNRNRSDSNNTNANQRAANQRSPVSSPQRLRSNSGGGEIQWNPSQRNLLTPAQRIQSDTYNRNNTSTTTSGQRSNTSPSQRNATVSPQRASTIPPSQRTVRTRSDSTSASASRAPDFSTADRTILEELKRNIQARDAQFVVRGGRKHHPFLPGEVPYPRDYDRLVVDHDVWETQFVQQVCGSVTWHVFERPPTKVLDLGCGTGSWILECARQWKDCHFVGLDIVPLHPDLQQVGLFDLASRVTWVQANFLDKLPFPNEEFDYVHIKRIARGVPEDKWDSLFDEISRVMKPGGAFEMIEEDLYFPGMLRDTASTSSRVSTPILPSTPPRTASASPVAFEPKILDHSPRHQQHDTETTIRPETLSPPSQHFAPSISIDDSHSSDQSITRSAKVSGPSPYRPNKRHSFASSLLFLSDLSTASALSLSDIHPRGISLSIPGLGTQRSEMDLRASARASAASPPRIVESPPTPSSPAKRTSQSSSNAPLFLLRTLPKAPPNPRDHALLETIYSEMHSSRFVNLAPLALLPNYLSLYFKDVRTHMPIIVTFPPPSRNHLHDHIVDDDSSSSSDEDEPFDAPHNLPPGHRKVGGDSPAVAKNPSIVNLNRLSTYVGTKEVMRKTQPYVTVDSTRTSALSPTTRASILAPLNDPRGSTLFQPRTSSTDEEASLNSASLDISETLMSSYLFEGSTPGLYNRTSPFVKGNRLPNKTFNFDLQSLQLHLSTRVSEILACREAMWDWVLDYQLAARSSSPKRRRQSGIEDEAKRDLIQLTRGDFEELLMYFELDMKDHTALGNVLEERFSWNVMHMARTQDRKAFEAACDRWTEYQQDLQNQRQRLHHSASILPTSNEADEKLGPGGVRRSKSDAQPLRRNRSRRSGDNVGDSTREEEVEEDGVSSVLPTQRLSRTLRVFVCWKP
ncbi:hypothetical protein JAAARDRAFT_170906 [Jaapia argillacea MUCL 33604]|uniref:Methyltransferase domain-containing protein n=1 Tax=Jaapia argillacea MUCL 33604 TaxID=933084 RepID=A0A067QIR6_9AGAM|nr:hypothetical protein JAAARDRAFT_170906 [Jaapia argillacea MUCL 33604]